MLVNINYIYIYIKYIKIWSNVPRTKEVSSSFFDFVEVTLINRFTLGAFPQLTSVQLLFASVIQMHANGLICHLFWANHYDIMACHQTSGQLFWVILSPSVCTLCCLFLCGITHLPGVGSRLCIPTTEQGTAYLFLADELLLKGLCRNLQNETGVFSPILLLNSNLPPFTHTANLAVRPRQPLPVRPGLILFSERLKQEVLLLFQSYFIFTGEIFFQRIVNAANLRNLSWLFTIT